MNSGLANRGQGVGNHFGKVCDGWAEASAGTRSSVNLWKALSIDARKKTISKSR